MRAPLLLVPALAVVVVAMLLLLADPGPSAGGPGAAPPGPEGLLGAGPEGGAGGAGAPAEAAARAADSRDAAVAPDAVGGGDGRTAASERHVVLLTGRVRRPDGSVPAGAYVSVTPSSGAGIHDDVPASGAIEVLGPPGDLAAVVLGAPGHVTRRFRDVPERTRLDVVLEPGSPFFGRVATLAGEPVDGAAIRLVPRGRPDLHEQAASTGDDGAFRFDVVAAGRYDVTVTHDDWAPLYDTSLVVPAPEGLEKHYVLIPGIALPGEVRTWDQTHVVTGARIEVTDRVVRGRMLRSQSRRLGPFYSDGEGRFRIPGLAPGRVRLSVKAPGFAVSITEHDVGAADGPQQPVVVRLRPGIEIAGVVADPDGRPVPWARVSLEPAGGLGTFREVAGFLFGAEELEDAVGALPPAITCDARGRFRIDGGVPGRGFLQAFDPEERFAPSPRTPVELRAFGSRVDVDLRLRRAGAVHGRVLDPGGRGVGDAVAAIGRVRARTGPEGAFELARAPEGPGTLRVRHPRFRERKEDLEVPPGGLGPLVLRLDPGGTVRGTVTDRRGSPIVGARATAFTAKPRRRVGGDRTGFAGRFHIGGLEVEKVILRVDAEGYAGEVLPETWTGERPLRIRLARRDWEPAGDVVGRVFDAGTGQAPAGLAIAGVDAARVHLMAGYFLVQNLPAGTRTLAFRAPGYQTHRERDVRVLPARVTELEPVALHRAHELRVRVVLRGGAAPGRKARVRVRLVELAKQGNPRRALRARPPAGKRPYHRFPSLRRGPYELRVSARGHRPVERRVTVGGGTKAVRITLRR